MTKVLDYNGLSYFWSKIKSFFVSKTDFEQTTQNLESEILLPNFDEMTPIKTIELDVTATSYYKLFSRVNTDISSDMHDVNDIVMFRITCSGTGIYSKHDFFVRFRPALLYPLVVGSTDTFSAAAATTGVYVVRFQYPKTLNSGYDWIFDFRTYNATARHLKVEVFATTNNISWYDELTATTYNSTYQSDGSLTLYDRRGAFFNGTLYTNALTASTSSYTTSMHNKYMSGSIIKAGEALANGYMLYVSNGYVFRVSNKNNPIDVDYGINVVGTSYSVNSYLAYNQFRAQQALTFTVDANLTYDPIAVGDKVYLRCRLVGDKIYSDGHLSTKMAAGYTWYMLGGAYSTTQVSLNTLGSMFITLDENGMISHINGKPTQAALLNGTYERRFCGGVESSVGDGGSIVSAEGRSIVFNQLVENGDFGNNTTGWAATNSATLSASENVLSAYRSNGQAYFGAVTTGNNGKVYKDHKYFYSIYAKASKTMNAYTPYFDSTYVTKQQSTPLPFQLTTEWKRFVGLAIGVKDGQSLFGIRNYTSNVGEATIYIKNAILIDLTKMFGAGNEPQDTELLKQMFSLDYYDYNLDGTLLGGTQTGFKSEDSSNNTLTNLSIPITTLTGTPSGGTSEVMFPNGLLGIGDVRDEIDFENGTAIKRIGVVDLGSLTWLKNIGTQYYATLSDIKSTASTLNKNILCERYISANSYAGGVDKAICGYGGLHLIWLTDSSYSDAATLTTSLDGVYMHYELATPIEYTIDTVPTVEYETERGGTEKWLPVNTSTPTVAPICCITRYGSGIEVPEYTMSELTTPTTGYEASYVLKKDGTQVGDTINIPKDYRLKSGTVEVVTTADTPYTGAVVGDKYLDLVVNTLDNSGAAAHIYVPLIGVGAVYTAGNGININGSNVISVKIDSNNAHGLSVGANGLAFDDSNLVHKTGNETITGEKTFNDGVFLNNSTFTFLDGQDSGVYIEEGEDYAGTKLLLFSDVEDDSPVRLGNVALPTQNSDAANKEYVDDAIEGSYGNTEVYLNGTSGTYGINPLSLCAYGFPAGSSSMYMTSFTGTSGSGGGSAITGFYFPIGCKIYYNQESQYFNATTEFVSRKFHSTYKSVDARYSSQSGANLSLSKATSSSVYLRVVYDSGYWRPYHKQGVSYENIVTQDQLISENFYIYLGKTVGTTGYMFQLEDNNPMYYCHNNDLIDWSLFINSEFYSAVMQNFSNYYTKQETYSQEEIDDMLNDISNFTYVVIEPPDTLPTASASTMGKMYIYNGHRYITVENNGSYSWFDMGSYDIDLTDYVTEEELADELEDRPVFELVTEQQMQTMIANHTWVEGVMYYSEETES